jgi:serine protease AprX
VAAHHRLLGSGSIGHVAWADYPTGEVRYRAIRFVPGVSLGLRGTVSLALGGGVDPPSVASRCEEVHVAWGDSGEGAIRYRGGEMQFTSAETTSFAAAVPTGLAGQSPSIAVDGLGNVELAMLSGGAVTESRRSRMSGSWSAPVPVSDPAAVPHDPSIAVDTRGAVHVIWTDDRDVPPGSGGAYYDLGGCLAVAVAEAGGSSIDTRAVTPRAAISPELAEAVAAAAPGERLPVLIAVRERPDAGVLGRSGGRMTGAERRRSVVGALRAAAGRTQARVLADLATSARDGLAGDVRSLWSANAVAARVAPAALERLAGLDEVETILFDPTRPMLEAESEVPARRARHRTAGVTATPAWSVSWIGAPAVWDQGYRGAGVLVAIIDTGVDYNHPDLAARIWTNAGEIPGNAIDDDGNGVVDDVHGYDSANDDGDPLDDNGHGTHVGGSVAGDGAGGTITGVAPEASLMAVKVLGAGGGGTFAGIMAGVEYALENGAQVLNLSLGGLCTSPATRALLRANADAVAAAGISMCVASANDRCKQRPPNLVRSPGDAPPPWLSPDQPPIGALGGVTTVGATGNLSDQVTTFSSPGPVDWSQPAGYGDWRICDPGTPNIGLIKPDVSAPGLDVISTILGGGYGNNSGTSMATPHVAGLAALILSRNPQLTSAEVHEILETTALDLGPSGKDNDYGAGRIRAPRRWRRPRRR